MHRVLHKEIKVIHVVLTVIIGLLIVLIFHMSVFRFKNHGISNLGTFNPDDTLIASKIHYLFTEPSRGDFVIFKNPDDYEQFYVKRIVGLPGESIEIKNNTVIVYNAQHPEGYQLRETYLRPGVRTDAMVYRGKNTLGSNEYWVLGDNRPESYDSRGFGKIQKQEILGKILYRMWLPVEVEDPVY